MKIKLYTHPENRQYLKKKDNTEGVTETKKEAEIYKKKKSKVNNEY
jgi:hypothetical protein